MKNNLELRCLLAAGSVDKNAGIIRGATVALAGVPAVGHRVMLDKAGAVTWDPEKMARELPVFTDEKTIDTLMSAVAAGGGKFKSREDHNDAIGARAGFSSNFQRRDGKVSCDVELFASYKNRDVVLETADKTPTEIGLSIDFIPSFELLGDRALMRVDRLDAVDIVDKGAVTPGGMFLSAGVDTAPNNKPAPAETSQTTMADDPKKPEVDPVLAAIGKLTDTVTSCMTQMATALSKPAAPAPAAEATALAAINNAVEGMSAQLKSISAENFKLKREARLLGFRGTEEERRRLLAPEVREEDVVKAIQGQKTFLQLSRAKRDEQKISIAAAQKIVLATEEGRMAFRAHMDARGITPKVVDLN